MYHALKHTVNRIQQYLKSRTQRKAKRYLGKLKPLRLIALLIPFSLLATIALLFGMIMALAAEVPQLENRKEYQHSHNSVLVDINGQPLGIITDNHNRILVSSEQITKAVKFAVV